MKTYTEKQYNSAKERAYNKGYKTAKEEITIDEAWDNVDQVNSWYKWEQFDFDWSVVAIVVVSIGIIASMITYSPNF